VTDESPLEVTLPPLCTDEVLILDTGFVDTIGIAPFPVVNIISAPVTVPGVAFTVEP